MKVHRPLAAACRVILDQVLGQGKVLDHVVAQAFRAHPRWGKRDRHFIADSVWEVVRWRRRLAFLAESESLDDGLEVVWIQRGYELPPQMERRRGRVAAREARLAEQPRAVRESVPDWLDEAGLAALGDAWEACLGALNQRAPVFVRVNRLLTDRDRLLSRLQAEGVAAAAVPELVDGIRLSGMLPRRLAADGRLEIQDGGSQRIAPFLQVEPGMRVVDACAGAGGKTLHLAVLMANQGELVALDISQRRLEALQRRAAKAGVKNLQVELATPESMRRWKGWADRVLVDAPCSGLGTLRRQPDLKWRLTPARLAKLQATQDALLAQAPGLLRADGSYVYATCSILPSENEARVRHAIASRPGGEILAEHWLRPGEDDGDGFYMARAR